jgi:energy-coupling factor transport system permease protein
LFSSAWRNLWQIKWLIVIFLIVAMLMWPVFYRGHGQPLFRLGLIAPSVDALSFALAMGLRLIALLVAGIVFLSATRIEDIAYGFQKLGMPYRVSFAFSLAFRLTPLFMETASQIFAAQRARGLDLHTSGWLKRLKGYAAILAPVLITSLRRADGLALALEARGFGRSAQRTSIVHYQASWRDWALILVLGSVILLTASWRVWSIPDIRAALTIFGNRGPP